jgi:hypothetical protein
MQAGRPSYRELDQKLISAKNFLKNRPGIFANPAKAVGELSALGVMDSNDIWALIRDLLEEITPKDYRGTRPPQLSYEKTVIGHELFALKNERFFYVSLHQHRSEEEKGEAHEVSKL